MTRKLLKSANKRKKLTIDIEVYIKKQINNWFAENNQVPDEIIFDKPKFSEHGDLATNIAMKSTRIFRDSPVKIAARMRTEIQWDSTYIKNIEIAGPGFINFFIANSYYHQLLQNITREKENFGKLSIGSGKKVLVEFVSANPTGPLTIGHGRQAVLGDVVARLHEWCGYQVEREYYFNDAGRQMRVLGDSVRFRYLQLLGEEVEFPDDHYQGEYITDIAKTLFTEFGHTLKDGKDNDIFKERAEKVIFADINSTLKRLRIDFDHYFNEKSLYENGGIEEVLTTLDKLGLTYKKDDALWFKTSALGFDQDRVLVKSTTEPTYRLPDIAYHQDKFRRGYDKIIDLFGADHIATYPDVLAALKVLDWDTEKIEVLIHQFVTLYEGQQIVKMSTRKANFVTLDELMDEVGIDVTRFFFIMRHMNSHLNFDLQLAKTESDENPVFYNQYAHARISSIFRKAADTGITINSKVDFSLLKQDSELSLIKHLVRFPFVVQSAMRDSEPQRIANFINDTSAHFHRFYQQCRVVGEEENLMQARFQLLEATRQILKNGLDILGVSAPDKM